MCYELHELGARLDNSQFINTRAMKFTPFTAQNTQIEINLENFDSRIHPADYQPSSFAKKQWANGVVIFGTCAADDENENDDEKVSLSLSNLRVKRSPIISPISYDP